MLTDPSAAVRIRRKPGTLQWTSVLKHSNTLSTVSASERGDRRCVPSTNGGGCGGGDGGEKVGGLLIDIAEDKGDVKPSKRHV